MGPGGIATIIAASSLAIIAVAIAYAVVRLGRLVDEAKASLKALTEETTPLLEEVTTTVTLVNGPLHSINRISKSAEDLTEKIASATGSFMDKNNMAMKAAGVLLTAAQMKKKSTSKPKKSAKRRSSEESE